MLDNIAFYTGTTLGAMTGFLADLITWIALVIAPHRIYQDRAFAALGIRPPFNARR